MATRSRAQVRLPLPSPDVLGNDNGAVVLAAAHARLANEGMANVVGCALRLLERNLHHALVRRKVPQAVAAANEGGATSAPAQKTGMSVCVCRAATLIPPPAPTPPGSPDA